MARRSKSRDSGTTEPSTDSVPSDSNPENSQIIPTNGPQFGEPAADQEQLRIEYHPSSDGEAAKTPDDSVTVDIASRKLVPYKVTA
jgi:hypothetical protein